MTLQLQNKWPKVSKLYSLIKMIKIESEESILPWNFRKSMTSHACKLISSLLCSTLVSWLDQANCKVASIFWVKNFVENSSFVLFRWKQQFWNERIQKRPRRLRDLFLNFVNRREKIVVPGSWRFTTRLLWIVCTCKGVFIFYNLGKFSF